MAMRLSGLMSGMDTESIVTQLVEARKTKVTKAVKAQKSLGYKQEAWKSLNSQILKLYDGALSNMRFSSAYMKKVTKVSDSSVASVITNEGAMNSVQSLKVEKLAQSGYMTGGKLELVAGAESEKLNGDTRLSEIGLALPVGKNGTIKVRVGKGEEKTVTVNRATTINDFVSQLRSAGVSANFDANNGRIYVAALNTGVENDFKLLAGDVNGWSALNVLGLNDADSSKAIAEDRKNALESLKKLAAENPKLKESLAQAFNVNLAELEGMSEEAKEEKLKEIEKNVNENLDVATVYHTIRMAVNGVITSYPLQMTESEKAEMEKLSQWRDNFKEIEDMRKANERIKNALSDPKVIMEERKKALESLKTLAAEPNSELKAKLDEAGIDLDNCDLEKWEQDGKLEENLNAIQRVVKNAISSCSEDGATEEQKAELKNLTQWHDNFEEIEDLNAAYELNREMGDFEERKPKKVEASDAAIILNGLEYTSSRNSFEINGLTITASATGDAIITTEDDTDGIYDMIKNFFKEYNTLINQMDKMYNAESASEYEPLTDEEKEAMSDSAVEEWEKKIKDSILRRDSSLNTIANAMKQIMMEGVEVNGKKMYLSNFGIETLSYFTAAENEKNAYHIAGDSDDSQTAKDADKLKSMIASDPNTVVEFFSKLSQNLYGKMTEVMGPTEYSSAYTAYDDKKMKTEYEDYKTKIKELEKKLADYEDQWYAKFAAMETAMAKMQSNASAVTSLLGGS